MKENTLFPLPLGVCQLRLEPEQHASAGAVGAHPHKCGHLGYEGALALRGHVFLLFLLAHRGSLELLHQLPALVRLNKGCLRIYHSLVIKIVKLLLSHLCVSDVILSICSPGGNLRPGMECQPLQQSSWRPL